MTQDEIIRMATEVWGYSEWKGAPLERLECFAALVAAHECEKCAEICDYFAGEWEWDTETAVGLATRIREMK